MRQLKSFVIGLTLVVSACGGGGGGPDGPGQPTITPGSPPAGATGIDYPAYTFTVASGGASPFTWSETGALPPGLALDSAGQLAGTPVTAGTYAFTVMVADSSRPALTATLPVSLKIDESPLVITLGQTPPAGVHGTPYDFKFTATGGSLPLSWTVTAGTLPPGLTLNSNGTLNGTPTAARTTPFTFTVTVTDSLTPTLATSSVAYAITISEPPPPTINGPPPPTATVGSPYSFQFNASDGLAPLVWNPPTVPMGGLAVGIDGLLSGTPTTAGIFPITLTVKDALNQTSPATPFTVRVALARPAAAFTSTTGNMTAARDGHTATLLGDGRVLIAGGFDGSSRLASAELYDPASKMFTATTGSMTIARTAHTATLLANATLPNYGKVLVVSGVWGQTAELYDPAAGTFAATTGSTVAQHLGQTATLLQNGQILIAGGETATAELFNPSTGTFTATGNMTVSRSEHTATLLSNGRVLITGGVQVVGPVLPIPAGPGIASAELYDPESGTFTSTGSMQEGRSRHTATLLVDGTVLIVGTDNTSELFDPGTGTFLVAGDHATGVGATATLRTDGTVLVAGGRRIGSSRATAELFAPESGGFVATGSLISARDGHTATLLVDGTVLITGGTRHRSCRGGGGWCDSDTVLSSAELYK